MVRWCSLFVAIALLAACPSPGAPSGPVQPDDTALRSRVAQAEARRAGGVAELTALASHGGPHDRVLALRGLGRIGATGGAPVIATLVAALGDADPEVVGAAAGALGVAGSLDDGDLGATDALIAALERAGSGPGPGGRSLTVRGPVVEALGRAGTAAAQPVLIRALAEPTLAELAGLALGRHGRRKIALAEPSRQALVAATASGDPAVRYAAVYALAREHEPPADPAATTALIHRLGDPVAEVRAQAIAGLGKRKSIAAAREAGAPLDALLLDLDWRVAVEAVRALGDSDPGIHAIAAALVRRYGELERGDATAAHVVLEAERQLATAAQQPIVASALAVVVRPDRRDGPDSPVRAAAAVSPLTRGWIVCLAIAAIVRGQGEPDLTAVERCPLPDHLKLPLVAELISANLGTIAARRAALARLVAHPEPRVRAASLGAVAAMWKAGEPRDQRDAMPVVVTAIASPDPDIAGAAVDAAAAIYDAIGTGDHGWLDPAVIARAAKERDPELGAALVELVGKRGLSAGAVACRAALTGDPVRAKAGAACLRALGEPAPAIATLAATPPPVDVSTVIGKHLRWRVATSRGEVVIRLRPDTAPWAVAAIVALTRKGFYDGLEFHRVVPNFVVQGGDPTQSGSGGPGFALPAEPAAFADGTGYIAGGVGIADAGRDSGGSQWFVMHSRAPHLDGRYTWFGAVESGQKSMDSLVVGDRVLRATIEIVP